VLCSFDMLTSVMNVLKLGEFIRNQRRSAGVSVRKLATLAGVSNPYLSQVERGLRRPSAEMLQAIAKGLRISAQTLYVQAGILEEDPKADVQAAIMGDPRLTERQKQALLEVYDSFREETERRRTGRKSLAPEEGPATALDNGSSPVRARSKTSATRSKASGRAETQAVPKPSPGSPSLSRSPSRSRSKGGATK
jgi:transcriptional regulator with XRE-family HTH domain